MEYLKFFKLSILLYFKKLMINIPLYIINCIVKSLNIIAAMFIMYAYIKVKQFRKKPGDLFFMIALNSLLYALANLYFKYEAFENPNLDTDLQHTVALITWYMCICYRFSFSIWTIIEFKKNKIP